MATALIDAMTSEWDPTKYEDQYQTALMKLIEEKAQKRTPTVKPVVPRVQPNVIDMVAVLQQSLQRAGVKKKSANSNGRAAVSRPHRGDRYSRGFRVLKLKSVPS